MNNKEELNKQLLTAAKEGDTKKIKNLLSDGAEVNTSDWGGGLTPLLEAAFRGHLESVKLLIHSGANINAATKHYGNTAIELAMSNNCPEIVSFLLSKGADIHQCDSQGGNALLWAVEGKVTNIIREILELKPNLDHQNMNGLTALHLAVIRKNVEIVNLLIQNGANLKIADNFGRKPIQLAEHGSDIGKLLKQHMKKTSIFKRFKKSSSTIQSSSQPEISYDSEIPDITERDTSQLIVEIRNLAEKINNWKFEDSKEALQVLNNNAHQIGKELNRRGGKRLMLQVFQAAGSHRTIESAWDGIGEWRG